MQKKKVFLILLIAIVSFLVFAAIVITLFHSVSSNPVDKIAMTYLWNDSNIESEYGEIVHIGRNIIHKAEKDDTTTKTAYTVETETGRVDVYVTLVKHGEEWRASSWELIEVKPNE